MPQAVFMDIIGFNIQNGDAFTASEIILTEYLRIEWEFINLRKLGEIVQWIRLVQVYGK